LEKTPNTIDQLTAPNVMNRSTPSSDLGSSLELGFHAKKKNSLKHHRNVKPCSIDNKHVLGGKTLLRNVSFLPLDMIVLMISDVSPVSAVEGRLNRLLDQDGGISRRKVCTFIHFIV
jgi:histone-lysine N-methyltransferase SETD2